MNCPQTTLEKESAFQRIPAFDQKSLLPSQEERGQSPRREAVSSSARTKDGPGGLAGIAEPALGHHF